MAHFDLTAPVLDEADNPMGMLFVSFRLDSIQPFVDKATKNAQRLVLNDGLGEVTKVRNMLKYYPEAVWKKRLARKCAEISQSKSNVIRSPKRKDNVTASLALHFYIKEAIQICFLLNHKYAPFYKWLYRAFVTLPKLSRELREEIVFLCIPRPVNDKLQTLDKVLDRIRNDINVQMPFTSNYDKFYIISDEIYKNIDDSDVREIDIWDTAEY